MRLLSRGGTKWLLLALAQWLTVAAPLFAAEIAPVPLGAEYEIFAFNSHTGDLLAVSSTAGTLTLFRSGFLAGKPEEKIGPVKVGTPPFTPVLVTYKKYLERGIFAVAGAADGNIYLFDAKDLSLIKKVPAGLGRFYALVGVRASESPFIYYATTHGSEPKVGRIHLGRLADEGAFTGQTEEIAISAQGTFLYESDLLGTRCYQIINEKPPLVRVADDWAFGSEQPRGQCAIDGIEQFAAVGVNLMSVDLRRKLAVMDFPIQGFSAKRPLVFGESKGSVWAGSSNSFKTLAHGELPAVLQPKDRPDEGQQLERFGRVMYRPQLFVDDAHEQVIFVRESHAAVISWKSLNLPVEPSLVAQVDGPAEIMVGQLATWKIVKDDPSVSWKLREPPAGLRVVDDHLEWTPEPAQVGPHEVVLVVSYENVSKSRKFTLSVVQPVMELPFSPVGLACSRDGKCAVVWSASMRPKAADKGGRLGWATKIAVIDAENLTLRASASLPFRAGPLATDGTHVFVAARENYLQVLPIADLTQWKQAKAEEKILDLEPAASNTVLVGTGSGRALRFSIPDLKPNRPAGSTASDKPGTYRSYPSFVETHNTGALPPIHLRRLPEGLLIDGALYNDPASRPQLLVAPPGFFPVQASMGDGRGIGSRMVFSDDYYARRGYREREVTLEHLELPLKITASLGGIERFPNRLNNPEQSLTLDLADLAQGTVKDTIAIDILAADRDRAEGPLVASAGKGVLVVMREKLYRVAPAQLEAKKYPPKFGFVPEQSALAVDVKGTITLKHQLQGAKAPVKFKVTYAQKEMQFDENTGDLTVPGPQIVAAAENYLATEAFALSFLGQTMHGKDYFGAPLETLFRDYTAATAATFEYFVGRRPEGIPVILPIGLQAVDADNRTADLRYFVFLELPTAHLIKTIEEHRAAGR